MPLLAAADHGEEDPVLLADRLRGAGSLIWTREAANVRPEILKPYEHAA